MTESHEIDTPSLSGFRKNPSVLFSAIVFFSHSTCKGAKQVTLEKMGNNHGFLTWDLESYDQIYDQNFMTFLRGL